MSKIARRITFATPWFLALCLVAGTACAGEKGSPTTPSSAIPPASEPPTAQPPGQWYVTLGGAGDGTEARPFGRIQEALDAAGSGETIIISDGTYHESLVTQRDGVRVVGVGDVMVTASGRVLDVQHRTTFEALAFNGQLGDRDTVRVRADNVRLLGVEVFNSGRDGIDVGTVSGFLVANSHIHHCIWPGNDAHGIAGGLMSGAVVRNTRIHDVTGDGIQLDAGRAAGHWDLHVEDVDISNTGEDGIDTKTGGTGTLTVVGGTYRGFRSKTNSAAFNMKESVSVTIDGVSVSDANIGFRLRHPADVRLSNVAISDSDRGVRYEDGITEHPLVSVTFTNVDQEIQQVN